MNDSPVEAQLRIYGDDLYERCSDRRLTGEDAAPSPSQFPRAVFVIVLTLFVVGIAAIVIYPRFDEGGPRPPALAPESGDSVDDGATNTTPDASAPQMPNPRVLTVDKATIQEWIKEAERHYGVSVGDLCPPTEPAAPTGLVMTLSVLDPIGFGSCRVVGYAPLQAGPPDAGNLPMGTYDQNGNLLDENSPNMPIVERESPVYGQTGDGSFAIIGTEICITDSNGGRYCSSEITNKRAITD